MIGSHPLHEDKTAIDRELKMRCAKNRIYLNSPEFHQLIGNFSNHDNCLIAVLLEIDGRPDFPVW